MNVEPKRSNCFLDLIVSAASIALLCFLDGVTVHAAEQIKASPQASETKQAIPDSEIIPRAEQTVKSLQKIKSDAAAANSTLSSIQKEFAALAEKSDRRRESEAETISQLPSAQRLTEIQREWGLEQSQLEDWDQALAKRSQVLVAQGKDIDKIIETWRATQAAVAKKFFFKAVLERRVQEVLRGS